MIPSEPFTLEQVVEATEAVVGANPRKKNRACLHFTERGKPVCVVGHVLHGLGVTAEDCRQPNGVVEHTASYLDLGIVRPDAREFLTRLQDTADRSISGKARERKNWGTALKQVQAAGLV